MMRLKRILVPVDFSKEAELALEWAVKLANEEKDSTIYLLHTLLPMPVVEGGIAIGGLIEAQEKDAKEKVDEWRRKVPRGLSPVTFVGTGDPVQEITDLCAKEDIDLVVMTTHGRHGLSRLVRPNLSEKVVREAPCPVLVLHLNPKMQTIAETGT